MCCFETTPVSDTSLTHYLSDYLPELKLADVIYAYLANPFISTQCVDKQYLVEGWYLQLFDIAWGDNSSTSRLITTYDDSELPHEYAQAGKYI